MLKITKEDGTVDKNEEEIYVKDDMEIGTFKSYLLR